MRCSRRLRRSRGAWPSRWRSASPTCTFTRASCNASPHVEIGAIRPEAFETAFEELCRDADRDADLVLAAYRAGPDDEDLLAARLEIVRDIERRDGQDEDAFRRRALGEVMPYVLGRVAPEEVVSALDDVTGAAS